MEGYIDSHQHFWRYQPEHYGWISAEMEVLQQDFLPNDLRKVSEGLGFAGSVAVQARQMETENYFLLELAGDNDFIKGIVGWIDLQQDDLESKLEPYREIPMMKGFRHIVQGEPDPEFMLRAQFLRGIKMLAKHNFTYDILIYSRQLPQVIQFLEKLPEQPFVLDHAGKPDIKSGEWESWVSKIKQVADYKHVHCKVSGLVTEADWDGWDKDQIQKYIQVLLDSFGVERLMFGSDWPVCKLAANYREVYDLVSGMLSESEKQQVFRKTAVDFYQLD